MRRADVRAALLLGLALTVGLAGCGGGPGVSEAASAGPLTSGAASPRAGSSPDGPGTAAAEPSQAASGEAARDDAEAAGTEEDGAEEDGAKETAGEAGRDTGATQEPDADPTGPDDGSTECATSFESRQVIGSLVVPAGQLCVLVDVVVDGSVTVERGAILQVSRSTVRGDVTGTRHDVVTIMDTRIHGDLTLVDGATATVREARIDGDVDCSGNDRRPRGEDNRILGDRTGQCSQL